MKGRLHQITHLDSFSIIICERRICDVYFGVDVGSSDSTPLIFDKPFSVMDRRISTQLLNLKIAMSHRHMQ